MAGTTGRRRSGRGSKPRSHGPPIGRVRASQQRGMGLDVPPVRSRVREEHPRARGNPGPATLEPRLPARAGAGTGPRPDELLDVDDLGLELHDEQARRRGVPAEEIDDAALAEDVERDLRAATQPRRRRPKAARSCFVQRRVTGVDSRSRSPPRHRSHESRRTSRAATRRARTSPSSSSSRRPRSMRETPTREPAGADRDDPADASRAGSRTAGARRRAAASTPRRTMSHVSRPLIAGSTGRTHPTRCRLAIVAANDGPERPRLPRQRGADADRQVRRRRSRTTPATELGGIAIRAAVERAGLPAGRRDRRRPDGPGAPGRGRPGAGPPGGARGGPARHDERHDDQPRLRLRAEGDHARRRRDQGRRRRDRRRRRHGEHEPGARSSCTEARFGYRLGDGDARRRDRPATACGAPSRTATWAPTPSASRSRSR